MFFQELLFVLWFFLPVGIGNCAPIFAAHMPILKNWSYPLDCNLSFRGKRIFGEHKTMRGLVVGIISSIIVVYLQEYFSNVSFIQSFNKINYETINLFVFGLIAGLGAIGGDAIKSFFKRQFGILEGVSWFPFDQLDYVIGGIVTTFFYMRLSVIDYVMLVVVWFFLHLVFSAIGFRLKLKQQPL